jgi:hypothetical protein
VTLELADGVSFCVIDESAIFFDLHRDRYSAARACGLSAEASPVQAALIDRGLLEGSGRPGGSFMPLSAPLPKQDLALQSGHASLVGSIRAAWHMVVSARRIRRHGLARTVLRLRSSDPVAGSHPFAAIDYSAVLSSFVWIDRLFDQNRVCLTRSLAMREMLWRHALPSTLVIGVKLSPFAAHAWLQVGGVILNDRLERIHHYHPIAIF